MPRITQLAFALAVTFFLLPVSAQAQMARLSTVNVTSDGERVHLAVQGEVSEMRIEVVSESGDVVFESGAITSSMLDWNMRDAQGERVSPGTYLVTVTFRTAAGKLRKRVEQITVEEEEKPGAKTTAAPEAVQVTVMTSGATTAGRITKFATVPPNATTITNSVITEIGARIGIGTGAPTAPLTVFGNWNGQEGAIRLNGDKPTIRFAGTSASGNQSWIIHQGSNGPGNLEFFRRTGTTWGHVMSLSPAGNVGIGTNTPEFKLDVRGTAGSDGIIYAENSASSGNSSIGVFGRSNKGYGVFGKSMSHVGVGGTSDSGDGVRGSSFTGKGVFGTSESGYGVYGDSGGGYAGYFSGKVKIASGGLEVVGGCMGCSPQSDRHLKANFSSVNPRFILNKLATIPVQTWNYKSEPETVRHIGAMAQDFRAAFQFGTDDKTLNTVDAQGVTMAAIQALYQMMQEKDRQIDRLQSQVTKLERMVKQRRKVGR